MQLKQHILIGDSRQLDLPKESVHLVVTSPPYGFIKNYGDMDDQIGFGQGYDEYLSALETVWKNCFAALHPGCKMCIIVGDEFLSAQKYGRYRIRPIHADIIRSCRRIGLDYMGSIIWQKTTNTETSGGGKIMGSHLVPRDGHIWIDYEYIMLFKKLGSGPQPTENQKKRSKLTKKERKDYFQGHWKITGAPQHKESAPFPLSIPKRLVKMFSLVGEVVLDPFLGTGTTMLACRKLRRSCIGCELNRKLLPVIKEKTHYGHHPLGSDRADFRITKMTSY